MASGPTALPWEWIIEKLVDNKEIETPLLKAMIMRVPDIKSPSCSSLEERIALRYLEESVFSGKFEAHAIPLMKAFLGSSLQDSTDAEDLLLRICTEVVLGHIREVDEDGERDWEGFEDDLNQVFGEYDLLLPFVSRRNELLGLVKDKSSCLSALEKYPVEVLRNDLLHFIHGKKNCFSRTVIDQLVCDIADGRYTCTSFPHKKHVSTGDEIITCVSRKRCCREATLQCENRIAEGQKKLKHSENDISPSHVEKIKECIVARYNVSENDLQKRNTLGSQTGNLNNDLQNTNDSSAMGSRQEVNCNRDKEIPQESSSTESKNNNSNCNCSKSTDDGDYGLEQQISEREEENNSDTEGRKENHILDSEELPEPDHLLLGNDCLGQSCLKCKDGGSLFYCDGCSIALHFNCLQSDISITSRESVDCPVCSYKKALAAYRTAKKEALESKKRLLAFIDIKAIQGNKQTSRDNCKSKEQVLPDTGNTSKDHSSHPCAFNLASMRKKLPSHSRSSKSIVHENELPDEIGNNEQSKQTDAHDDMLNGDLGESHHGNRKNRIRNKESSMRGSKSIVHENEMPGGIRNKQQFMQTDAHDCRLSGDLGENHYADRKNRIRDKKSSMRETFPLPGARRVKLPWTKDEEEILKEGTNKFPCDSNGMKWKCILEHGKGVFHNSRLPGDLKDKWRNMKKLKKGNS
ncbi:uncharacterized protein LOC131034069 isoform X1 [Cryptomeria japonica]|uniref:uncharacterized protein LOC131034069 isoform X1 n=1 Tax=Cryptomeria japonica TaxID=3369 RepID=UPI0025AB773D|nr:uncharacterized protein LOC131034069 isoform X1 [Cryptomeria japonica]XP_057821414.1 uncharacterized protein LOC131034069 isoform X1 [Cryptomeria japonica]